MNGWSKDALDLFVSEQGLKPDEIILGYYSFLYHEYAVIANRIFLALGPSVKRLRLDRVHNGMCNPPYSYQVNPRSP